MDDQFAKEASESEREARSAPPVPKGLLDDRLKVRVVHREPEAAKPLLPKPTIPTVPASATKRADVPDDDALINDLPPAEPIDEAPAAAKGKRKGFFAGYWRHKLWTLPLTIVAVLLIGGGAVLAMPTTRYAVLANFITRSFTVTVSDSITGSPVTGAMVALDGVSKTTNSAGKAALLVPVGPATVTVKKAYYKDASQSALVDLSTSANKLTIHLVATGRQVPVKVVNKITGKPIPEAVITVGTANAKTDLNGLATIVLPASPATQNAALAVDGYNNLNAEVQVTTLAVDANTFAMVPVGHVYFLSNLSGKVDVVSTNLDGSDRQTVVAGTGSEDVNNTVLLASRDWQYLALLSKRSNGGNARLFLINTTSGQLTTIDSSTADFALVGWYNHYFVYLLTMPPGQPGTQLGVQTIQSYNADTGKNVAIATSKVIGSSPADTQYQRFVGTPILLDSSIIVATHWSSYPSLLVVAGQQNTLMSYKVDDTGTKTLKSVDSSASSIGPVVLAAPNKIYFETSAGGSVNYYLLDRNQNITQSSTITSDSVNQNYPTYLISPSSTATFWSESRDGKKTLFVGDASGNGGSQIATLSDYAPYGWYGDSYLLAQKAGSELYIMPVAGGTPLKISDYYKPQTSLYGYGGGYGGL